MHSLKHPASARLWPTLSVAAILVALQLPVMAQNTLIDQTYVGRQTQAVGEKQARKAYRPLRASNIIGMSVRTARGENIGQIEDLVVDTASGKVRYAMLRFDPGFLSGERVFGVPVDRLFMASDRDDLVLSGVTREQLERAAIDRSVWNDSYFNDLSRVTRLDSAWGVGSNTARPVARVSNLLDRRVLTPQGRRAGELEELVIDMGQKQVHYAVVEFDRGWLRNDRRLVVPLTALTFGADGRNAQVAVERSELEGMPTFEQSRYGNLDDLDFLRGIDRVIVTPPVAVNVSPAGKGGPRGSN